MAMMCMFLLLCCFQVFPCGCLITTSQMKFPFKQLSYVSVYKYVFTAIIYNELHGETDTPERNATVYMETYDSTDKDRYQAIYFLGAFTLTFQVTYFMLLKLFHNGKK